MSEVRAPMEKAEMMTPRERVENRVYEEVGRWVLRDFPKALADLAPKEGMGREEKLTTHIALAGAQRDLARSMHLFIEHPEGAEKWRSSFNQVLFGDGPEAINTAWGEEHKDSLKNHFVGAISALTFYSLVESARPDLAKEIKFEQIFTDPETDVLKKIDFELSWTEKGKKYVRLIQLKTATEDNFVMVELDEGLSLKRAEDVGVKGNQARKVVDELKKRRADEPNADIRAFALLVPAYDTPGVNGVFGTIKDNMSGTALREIFTDELARFGLFPRKRI